MSAAVDANCISEFQRERILGVEADLHRAIAIILGRGHIILDAGGLCQQEWLDTAVGPVRLNLNDWIADLIVRGLLKYVPTQPLGNHRRQLLQLGLPKKDMKWFGLCRDGDAEIFLSEDIDFYNPREKRAAPDRRNKIKRRGPAPVKKYFRDQIGTVVTCCRGICEDL